MTWPGTPLAVVMAYRGASPQFPCGLALMCGPLRGGLNQHHLPWVSRCDTLDASTERSHAGGDICLSADASPANCLFTEARTWPEARAELARLIGRRSVLLPEPLYAGPPPGAGAYARGEPQETYPPDGAYARIPRLSPAEALALIDAAIEAAGEVTSP